MNRKIIAFIPIYNEKSRIFRNQIKENINCKTIYLDSAPDFVLKVGSYYSPKYVDEEYKYLLGSLILALKKGANTIIVNINNLEDKLSVILFKEKLIKLGYIFNYITIDNIHYLKNIRSFREFDIKFKFLNYLYTFLKGKIKSKLPAKNTLYENKVLFVGEINEVNRIKIDNINKILSKYNLETIFVNNQEIILNKKNKIKKYLKYPINKNITNDIYKIISYLLNNGKYIIYLKNESMININLISILNHIEKNYHKKILIINDLEEISKISSYLK